MKSKKKKNNGIEILIAEDSPTQAEKLQYLLEEHGYAVVTAPDGKQALVAARRRRPALVISDIVMPEMDGYALCKAIKSDEALRDVPVILLTTLSDVRDVMKGLESGADNFIRKPYEEKYLLARVDYLLMNLELRKNQQMQMGVEIYLGGQKHFITAERQQILDLLISVYEEAVHISEELKLREKELAHSNQIFQGLYRIADGLNHAASEREVLELALERALELPGIQAGWIFLREGESGFRLAAARNLPPALEAPGAMDSDCACRRQLISGEFGSIAVSMECERLGKANGDVRGLRYHSSIPLRSEGRTLGVMNLVGQEPDLFNEDELKIQYIVGNQLAVALERARLQEHLEQLVMEKTAKLTAEFAARQRTEEALRESELNYRIVADFTYDWEFWMAPEGRFAYVSPSCQRISGYAPGEFVEAASLLRIVHGEDRENVQVELKRALLQEVQAGFDFRIVTRDGLARWVSIAYQPARNAAGEFTGARGSIRDISLRVQADQAIRQALTTLDVIEDATFIFDPDTLRFSYVNEGALRQVGYTRAQFLEMTPLAIKPAFDETGFREMLAPMIRGELRTYRCTTPHRHRNGHDIPVEVNLQYVAPVGEKPRFIAIARDVTERQRDLRKLERAAAELATANAALENERAHLAERVTARTAELTEANEELARAKVTAEQASRAKSAFLATMSHEIRTPMNGVIGMVDVLAQSRLSEQQIELVKTTRESANVLLGIIDDILDFSKIEAGRLEFERAPVSVSDLIEGLCSSLAPVAARRNVDLFLFVSPDIPELVLSDDTRLRQVLYNLVGNAIKFSAGRPEKRGRVSVRALTATTTPLWISLRVIDNGIGIAPETVNGLFTPFTQAEVSTTRRFGGSGLGLAICKRLVDLMGGRIEVETMPGAGATFMVTLPFEAAAEQPIRSQPDLTGVDCVILESPHINPGDLGIYLEEAGARIYQAATAADAAQVATRLATPVVVILEAEHQQAVPPASRTPFSYLPNVRHLLITRGLRRRSRVEGPDTVSLDGDALRRMALLRAVAVAAGRASPEVFHERFEESLVREEPPTIAEARSQGRLILVAEDDEINQKVILQQLALLGYAAEIAGNGTEALRLWHEGRYALLLTDLHMPEMDGYTLAGTIRREERGRGRMPILALTANALRGEANQSHVAGMDDYLTKPVLLTVLKAALEKWLPRIKGTAPPAEPSEQAGGGAAALALDVAVLKGLVGDDADTLRDILTDYLISARRLAEEIHRAVAAGDIRNVGAIAHKLKSSSRSVGALALGDLCAELDNLGRTGDKAAIARSVAQFKAYLAEVEAEIAKILVGL